MNDILYVVLPFVISLVLTPLVKRIAYRLDAFAQVNERTVHSGKIVRIGGVAIYVAFIVSMAVFVKTDMAMNGILLGSTIIFIGGLIDDFVNLRPIYKFGFQVVAAIVLIASGVTLDVIRLPFGITISMGVVSVIVTFLWITGITNAVNLIDGLDGLCGGISVIILIGHRHAGHHRTAQRRGDDLPDPGRRDAGISGLQCASGQYLHGGLRRPVSRLHHLGDLAAGI